MAENYDVGARIDIDVAKARASTRGLLADVDRLGAKIRGTQTLLAGIGPKLFAFGSAYFGFRAITGSIERMSRYLYDFNAQTTQTRIGLASVFSAVEGLSFGAASKLAEATYQQLTADAIESVATTQELFDIYSGIVGPIRAAGFELEKVRDMTKDTVNASAALGVDFPQAKRDVAAMVRGAAGMDVKLFQTLRSMNLIKEDAKTFNAMMQKERVEKIADALKKAGVGGAAFGRSLPGRMSTFVDIIQQFGKAFSSPIFDTFAARLGQINDYLLKNKDSIMAYLDTVGTRVSLQLEVAFERAVRGAKWVSEHWDQIVDKTREVVDRMREVAPQLAKAYLGMTVGRQLLGGGMQAASMAGQLGMRLAGDGASTAAGAAAAAVPQSFQVPAAMKEGLLLGGAQYWGAEAFAGGASGGGAATAGAAAGVGGATAGIVAFGATVAALGSVFMAANDQWVFAKGVLSELLEPAGKLWDNFQKIGNNLWHIIRPLVRIVGGTLFTLLSYGLEGMVVWMERVTYVGEKVTGWFAKLADWLDAMVDFGFQKVLVRIASDLKAMNEFVYGPKHAKALEYSGDVKERGPRYGVGAYMPQETFGGKRAPAKRPANYFDFRNSKFSIKQDFKNDDPDRILRVFTDGLTKQAERRLQSPFRPAFSR